MPVNPTFPGVYIEEIPSGVRTIVGVATSGGYGHAVKKSLAFAYVKPELAATGTALEIAVLGQRRKAKVIAEPAYDPGNERLRG